MMDQRTTWTMKATTTRWTSAMGDVDVEAAWTVLETEASAAGITTVPADVEAQGGQVLIGVDGQSRRHLLVPLRLGEAAEDDRRGQAVHLVRVRHAGTT